MGGTTYEPLVTVSATYGAGGSVIAPRLADTLGVPFVDRLITADMSQDAAEAERSHQGGESPDTRRSQEGLCEGEQTTTPAGRFLSYFARAASVSGVIGPDALVDDDTTVRQRLEEGLKELEAGAGGVVLGRAAAVVLADRPRAFHIRLDGDVERRVAWAAAYENLDLEAARRRQSETDRARTVFVKRLFRVDPDEPRFYHLVLDATVLGIEPAFEVITLATRAFFKANP